MRRLLTPAPALEFQNLEREDNGKDLSSQIQRCPTLKSRMQQHMRNKKRSDRSRSKWRLQIVKDDTGSRVGLVQLSFIFYPLSLRRPQQRIRQSDGSEQEQDPKPGPRLRPVSSSRPKRRVMGMDSAIDWEFKTRARSRGRKRFSM